MLKCPNCGASVSKLTLDVNIRVTCTLKSNGSYELKPFWKWDEVNYATHEQIDEDDLSIFCIECGHDFKATLNDDMTISFKEEKK